MPTRRCSPPTGAHPSACSRSSCRSPGALAAELPGEVLIQTQFLDHPLYAALVRYDYSPAFANEQLKEREQAGFPPYTYQAMLRAEAPQIADSLAFLTTARAWPEVAEHADVMLYDPVADAHGAARQPRACTGSSNRPRAAPCRASCVRGARCLTASRRRRVCAGISRSIHSSSEIGSRVIGPRRIRVSDHIGSPAAIQVLN